MGGTSGGSKFSRMILLLSLQLKRSVDGVANVQEKSTCRRSTGAEDVGHCSQPGATAVTCAALARCYEYALDRVKSAGNSGGGKRQAAAGDFNAIGHASRMQEGDMG